MNTLGTSKVSVNKKPITGQFLFSLKYSKNMTILKVEKVLIMYPSKEQLESKWWHRLVKVLIWILTISALVYCTLLSFDEYSRCVCYNLGGNCMLEYLLMSLLAAVILTPITYFLFWLIYKKIILYIIFSSKNK